MNNSLILSKIKKARTLGEQAKAVQANVAKHGTEKQRNKLLESKDKSTVQVAMDAILDKHVVKHVFSANKSIRDAAIKRILKNG